MVETGSNNIFNEEHSIDRGEMTRGLKILTQSFTLPNRFRDNGITPDSLAIFTGTPSEVSPSDVLLVDQILEFKEQGDIGVSTTRFCETGREMGLTDRLATSVKEVGIISDNNSPFGFRVTLNVDTELRGVESEAARVDNNVNRIIHDVTTSVGEPKIFSFQLAQQLGHTLAMRSLRTALDQNGVHGIEFAIPNPDNAKLLQDEFKNGRALPWRQLFEPGYCREQSLVFPMDPSDEDFKKTVLMTTILNRHIVALTCAALAHGHEVILFNDARHEGPALFKAISDWAITNNVPGVLHTFHLGYLVMDPFLSLPSRITEQILKSRELLSERAASVFPGIQVAEGVDFMTWKMQAQLILQAESDSRRVSHHVLYQSSVLPEQLTLSLIPDKAKRWFETGQIKVIPEVAATTSKDDGVRTIAITVGTSGHSEIDQIVKHAVECAKSNPDISIILMGKGTDQDTVSVLIGEVPPNLQCLGIVPKETHDKNLASADTIVTKTSRNSRNSLVPSVLSGQGVILLPPESPRDIPDDISLFELSYLRETLMEHALDLMTALQVLDSLGVKNSANLVWQQDVDLLSHARLAKKGSLKRDGEIITSDSLAEIVLDIVGSCK